MSVTEANQYNNDEENPENKESFHTKRDRLIELIVEKGHNYRISSDDFEVQEKVVASDSTGERRWRPGCLFRQDRFEER